MPPRFPPLGARSSAGSFCARFRCVAIVRHVLDVTVNRRLFPLLSSRPSRVHFNCFARCVRGAEQKSLCAALLASLFGSRLGSFREYRCRCTTLSDLIYTQTHELVRSLRSAPRSALILRFYVRLRNAVTDELRGLFQSASDEDERAERMQQRFGNIWFRRAADSTFFEWNKR